MLPPPSPAEFSGFGCEVATSTCVLHGTAAHPGGGLAVFREVRTATTSGLRREGLTLLVDADGVVWRIARGVIVLRGAFDDAGNLHAVVEPEWTAGASDSAATAIDGPAIVELAPSGEILSSERLSEP